ncbi:MAG: tRNA-binding protein [Acidimicrobiia bacterium]
MSETPDMSDFESLGIRVGTIVNVDHNTGAREPAYRLWIDLGGEAPVQSSAKITERYGTADLINRQVVVVTGFGALRVGGFRSDVLVLGVATGDGVVLLRPDDAVPPGSRVS